MTYWEGVRTMVRITLAPRGRKAFLLVMLALIHASTWFNPSSWQWDRWWGYLLVEAVVLNIYGIFFAIMMVMWLREDSRREQAQREWSKRGTLHR